MNKDEILKFHTQELYEAHRQLNIAGIEHEVNGERLSISQRCALVREALVAWGSTQSVLTKAMQ